MAEGEPMCMGGFTLKQGLLAVIGLGMLLNMSAVFNGALAAGLIGLLIQAVGFYAVFQEVPLYMKIYGGLLSVFLIVYSILMLLVFNFAGLIILIVNNCFTIANLYALYIFHNYVEGKSPSIV
ncbi:hypothetical protein BC833DRAFT_611153 [Globomyces pollinis-pini]|nr:hypothetical protein BC833DRAFT_611153 [Globomyces pollinis-pini]